jgi:hypothetical protein
VDAVREDGRCHPVRRVTGNFFVLLSAATGLGDYSSQLGYDLLTGKPVPQNIDFIRGAASPQSGAVLDSVTTPASPAAAPSLFQPVPESQLASIEKLPFLRQRLGYAVAEVGAAALSQKYPAGWGGHAEERGVPTAARRLPLRLELSAERRSPLRIRPRRGDG